ncbi:MAG TPA: site-specific integrase [Rhizobiaceae bacterium]
MPKELPKGVSVDRDRHGNARLYFRAPGRPKVRLREIPETNEFDAEVACARLGIEYHRKDRTPDPELPKGKTAPDGTFLWLVQQYKARSTISAALMAKRARLLEEICESVTSKGKRKRGTLPFVGMTRKHVIEIRDEIRKDPGARNEVVKIISAMFGWAIEVGITEINPALRIKRLHSGDGFHTWTVEEVEKFEERHGAGTKARLALHLGLFTGLRREDLAIVGRQHIKDGWLSIRPTKNKRSKKEAVNVDLPILPILQKTIDETTDRGDLTFLVTEFKKPFSVAGLGNKMRQWCDEAGLPECSLHGLRKAGASIAAENGATDEDLMAIFGWVTKAQTTLYTKKARRKRIAGRAVHTLLREQKMDKTVPPPNGVQKSRTKTGKLPNKNNA